MKISTKRKFVFNSYSVIIVAIIYVQILFFFNYVNCDWLTHCGNCHCKWNSGKKTADCKNMTISMIPNYLSSELQVLDLSFNHIKLINDNAFINGDLKNLHKLFMRNCSLEIINSNSLIGLEILIEIDLSNNLIKFLPNNVFMYLIKIRSIILNNNLIEQLNDGLFCNLKYLHKIELKNNQLYKININVFINLPYLSQIFLNDNKLKFLHKDTFIKLKRLTSLSLDSNPWNCTCELQSFRDYALKHNLYTPPTSCYYPKKLRGLLWTDQTQPEAFACKPKILYPSRGASINTSKENVTLICRVHASPNTLIAWDYNKQMYSSGSVSASSSASASASNNHNNNNNNFHQARVHIQLLREDNYRETDTNQNQNQNQNQKQNNNNSNSNSNSNNNNHLIEKEIGRDVFISRLTIIGAEKSDEGTYTCLAENPGGKDEVQMNLLVQKHNHKNILFQNNNLIIVICLMVLGLLSASIFLAMITCCIYKRFKSINQLQNNDGNVVVSDHHHHIHNHLNNHHQYTHQYHNHHHHIGNNGGGGEKGTTYSNTNGLNVNVKTSINDPYQEQQQQQQQQLQQQYHQQNNHYNGSNNDDGENINYTDIKANGNLDIAGGGGVSGGSDDDGGITIINNNFSNLKDTNDLVYCENNTESSLRIQQERFNDDDEDKRYNNNQNYYEHKLQQQKTFNLQQNDEHEQQQQKNNIDISKTSLSDHHHQYNNSGQLVNGGEYQPDLLPYVPQSMSLGYAVNQVLSYDSQKLLLHPKHQHFYSTYDARKREQRQQQLEQQQQQQQYEHEQELPHRQSSLYHHHLHQSHQEDQILNDLQYTNIGYDVGREQIFNKMKRDEILTSCRTGSGTIFKDNDYVHYGSDIGSGGSVMPSFKMAMTASATTLVTQPTEHNNENIGGGGGGGGDDDDDDNVDGVWHNQYHHQQRDIYGDSIISSRASTTTAAATTASDVLLRRNSVVRASPSLNFLSNYHSRRQLL